MIKCCSKQEAIKISFENIIKVDFNVFIKIHRL